MSGNESTRPKRWRSAGTKPTPASLHAGADPRCVTSLTVERIRPGARPAQPDDRLDQLVLAVAGDAGDAEDLAGPDLEVDALDAPRCRGRP